MNIVPKDKHYHEACETLENAPDDAVRAHLPELLEWLQDMNWPVAWHVAKSIKRMKEDLITPIREILNSNDGAWKYNIIVYLIPMTAPSVISALKTDLQRLATNPTEDDVAEEVDLVARERLDEIP